MQAGLPTQIRTRSEAITLRVELHSKAKRVGANEVGNQLKIVGWLSGAVVAVSSFRPLDRTPPVRRARRSEPDLVLAHYGSPLLVVINLPADLLTDVAALSLLGYGLKRFWGFDLELKTHRETLWTRYHQAKQEAEDARFNALSGSELRQLKHPGEGTVPKVAPEGEERLNVGDEERGWGDGMSAGIENRRHLTRQWSGEEASIVDD
jgi:hypothetical protein